MFRISAVAVINGRGRVWSAGKLLERFEDFIDARKKLLRDRFKSLSVLPTTDYAAHARAELREGFTSSSAGGPLQ